jgi:hypothetical protein
MNEKCVSFFMAHFFPASACFFGHSYMTGFFLMQRVATAIVQEEGARQNRFFLYILRSCLEWKQRESRRQRR